MKDDRPEWTDEEIESAAMDIASSRPTLSIVPEGFVSNDWQVKLIRRQVGKKSIICRRPENVNITLQLCPDWAGRVWYDEHANRTMVRDPPWLDMNRPSKQDSGDAEWTDSDSVRLSAWIQEKVDVELEMSVDDIDRGVEIAAKANMRCPFREYLEGLEWDGVGRLDAWLTDYLNAEPGEYTSNTGRWWLLSAVARTYQPGCKADLVLILEGKQGTKKSTALATLVGQRWFADTPVDIGSKDAYLALEGIVIFELAELDSLRRADVGAAKAFFSSQFDTFRPPYGRRTVKMPRRCVFAATVNPSAPYLLDPSGARRYLPIKCGEGEIEPLAKMRDQLWAEAVVKYKAGMKWYPENTEQMQLVEDNQDSRTESDAWHEILALWVEGRDAISMVDLLEQALKIEKANFDRQSEIRVGRIMRKLGFERKRQTTGARAWRYIRNEST